MKSPWHTSDTESARRAAPAGDVRALIVIGSLAASMLLAFSLRPVIMREFEVIEQSQVEGGFERTVAALDARMTAMKAIATDWAGWDDAAEFMNGRNPTFGASQLQPQSLANIGVDGLLYFDNSRRLALASVLDESRASTRPVDIAMVGAVIRQDGLFDLQGPASRGGEIVATPAGPILAVSAPVMPSNLSPPIRGTLVAFALLDDEEISQIEQDVQLEIGIDVTSTPAHRAALVDVGASTPNGRSIQRIPFGDNRVAGVGTIYDDDTRHLFDVAVVSSREVYRSGLRVTDFLTWTILLVGLALGVATAALVEAVVRRRSAQQLEFLAGHDHLTQLPNRRTFEETLDRELARTRRSGAVGSLLWLDLDDFKSINDTYGHHVGDEVLVLVANVLRAAMREGDSVARIGGDEFAVLLPETTADDAMDVAARIRRELTVVAHGELGTSIARSASIGVVEFPHDGDTHTALMSRADTAMYLVKRSADRAPARFPTHGEAPPPEE